MTRPLFQPNAIEQQIREYLALADRFARWAGICIAAGRPDDAEHYRAEALIYCRLADTRSQKEIAA